MSVAWLWRILWNYLKNLHFIKAYKTFGFKYCKSNYIYVLNYRIFFTSKRWMQHTELETRNTINTLIIITTRKTLLWYMPNVSERYKGPLDGVITFWREIIERTVWMNRFAEMSRTSRHKQWLKSLSVCCKPVHHFKIGVMLHDYA